MFESLFPNVVVLLPRIGTALIETLTYMLVVGIVGIIIGLPIGVVLLVTGKGHLLENRTINSILSKILNLFRSVPFLILVVALTGFTRLIVGSSIGVKGAMVPLIIASIPFMARQFELALLKVDRGVIEAYQAMGFSNWDIIRKVILREGLGNLVQAFSFSMISVLSFTAIVGTVGGGGLGDLAMRYGHQMYQTDVMIFIIIIILILVYLIQWIGDLLYKKLNHN